MKTQTPNTNNDHNNYNTNYYHNKYLYLNKIYGIHNRTKFKLTIT